jgi:chloramphenicol 3-O-phosphotransferase
VAEERAFEINVGSEIDRYFDDSSIPQGESPRIVILMGGPAGGKTTIRKQRYATGYVLVDAGDIFIHLSRGEFFPFPEAFEEPMQIIGRLVAQRAISQRRHIVTELIGADFDATKAFIDAMVALGYRVEVQAITCNIEEAERRNLNRGDDNISCYYAEPYQRGWLHEAAIAALNADVSGT